jgi:multiple sugar transport system permease protein
MTARRWPVRGLHAGERRGSRRAARWLLAVLAIAWLLPFLWAVYLSFRPYADTVRQGPVSLPAALTLDNYARALGEVGLPHFLLTTAIVVVPSVVLVLLVSVPLAFAVSRFSWRANVGLLMLVTAGNLLPPQALIMPLFRLYLGVPVPEPLSDNGTLYDQYLGVIAIHVAFQLGFCTFVLSNHMKTIPRDLLEAAVIDGASFLGILRRIVVPLSRPAIVALAALETTWIYNDFFWALFLMRTGDKRPITSALVNLSGEFFTDTNLLAATAILVALPPLAVYLVLRRDLVRGLDLGRRRG